MVVVIFTAGNEILRMSKRQVFIHIFMGCGTSWNQNGLRNRRLFGKDNRTKAQDLQQEWKELDRFFWGEGHSFFERFGKISHKATCYYGNSCFCLFVNQCYVTRNGLSFLSLWPSDLDNPWMIIPDSESQLPIVRSKLVLFILGSICWNHMYSLQILGVNPFKIMSLYLSCVFLVLLLFFGGIPTNGFLGYPPPKLEPLAAILQVFQREVRKWPRFPRRRSFRFRRRCRRG